MVVRGDNFSKSYAANENGQFWRHIPPKARKNTLSCALLKFYFAYKINSDAVRWRGDFESLSVDAGGPSAHLSCHASVTQRLAISNNVTVAGMGVGALESTSRFVLFIWYGVDVSMSRPERKNKPAELRTNTLICGGI